MILRCRLAPSIVICEDVPFPNQDARRTVFDDHITFKHDQTAQSFPDLNGPLALRRRPTDPYVPDALKAALAVTVSRVRGEGSDNILPASGFPDPSVHLATGTVLCLLSVSRGGN
jgi:hypothetical protein